MKSKKKISKSVDVLGRIVAKLADHEVLLENIETKLIDHDGKFNALLVGQDKMIKILERVDQERVSLMRPLSALNMRLFVLNAIFI